MVPPTMNSLPAKLVGEAITVEFDFATTIPLGVTISSVIITSTVISGTDPYASRMIVGDARITGTIVKQWVLAGLAGVIYQLECVATFSDGHEDSIVRRLAVRAGQGTSDPFPIGYPLPLTIIGAAPDGAVGVPYTFSYTISGGVFPYTSDTTDVVIPGLAMPTFTLSGTPTTEGTYPIEFDGTDFYGTTVHHSDEIEITGLPTISGAAPDGFTGVLYPEFAYTLGGIAPLVVTTIAGAPPSPLVVNSDGVIEEVTPTVASTGGFDLRVTGGNLAHADHSDSITIHQWPMPVLLTSIGTYSDAVGDMSLLISDNAFTGSTTLVRISPDGLYAAVSIRTSLLAARFAFYKFNVVTNEWDSLGAPADMPTHGPSGMAWSHDSQYCAIVGIEPTDNFPWVYKMVADTPTRLALPATPLAAGSADRGLMWDNNDERLATSQADTGAGLVIYDFEGEELVNPRDAATFAVGTALFLDWHPTDDRYIAVGSENNLYVARDDDVSVAIAASSTLDSDGGCWWDASGDYFFSIDIATLTVFEFNANTPGTESIVQGAASPDTFPAQVIDVSVYNDRKHLAAACTQLYPSVMAWGSEIPPEPLLLTNPEDTASSILSVSFSSVPTP